MKEEVDEAIAELDNREAFVEELADVQEVLDQLHKISNIDAAELKKVQTSKREKRGGSSRAIISKRSRLMMITSGSNIMLNALCNITK